MRINKNAVLAINSYLLFLLGSCGGSGEIQADAVIMEMHKAHLNNRNESTITVNLLGETEHKRGDLFIDSSKFRFLAIGDTVKIKYESNYEGQNFASYLVMTDEELEQYAENKKKQFLNTWIRKYERPVTDTSFTLFWERMKEIAVNDNWEMMDKCFVLPLKVFLGSFSDSVMVPRHEAKKYIKYYLNTAYAISDKDIQSKHNGGRTCNVTVRDYYRLKDRPDTFDPYFREAGSVGIVRLVNLGTRKMLYIPLRVKSLEELENILAGSAD